MVAIIETDFRIPEIKRPVGVVIFDREKSKVLLVKHGPKALRKEGLYGIPAGRPRGEETPKETASRELEEETGLLVDPDNLIKFPASPYSGVNLRETGAKRYSMDVFIATKYEGELKRTDEDKPAWEAKPVWANIGTLNRRRNKLMPSVEQIVFDGLQLVND